jgi:hypothetical protein
MALAKFTKSACLNGVLERLKDAVKEKGEKVLEASDSLIEDDPVKLGAAAMKVAMSKAAGGKNEKLERDGIAEEQRRNSNRVR